jgi:DNA replication ATP-dependent helicase Dna2
MKCVEKFDLDLSTFKRCVVKEIQVLKNEKVIKVKEKKTGLDGKCLIKGAWSETEIKHDDIVSLKAIWDDELKSFVINNKEGMLVTSPDTLVSGTTIVGSLFCGRKSVLAERFRHIEGEESKIVS